MARRISRITFLKALYKMVLVLNITVAALIVLSPSSPLRAERMQTTTLRELAFQREHRYGDGRAVYVVLYEYYGAERLVITREAIDYIGPGGTHYKRYGRFATIEVIESAQAAAEITVVGEVLVEVPFGPEGADKVMTLLAADNPENVDVIYGVLTEQGVVFGPENTLR